MWSLARVCAAGSCGVLTTLVLAAVLLFEAPSAAALPLFARQTGQNCVACHAGGQFPELTAYGRRFKLTGYTIGSRSAVPLAVMGVASLAKVDSHVGTDTPASTFPRDGQFDLTTASAFIGGRLTNNLGAFVQWTYDVYDRQDDDGTWRGLWHVDQVDVRWADRFLGGGRDLIVGVSVNNNPGVSDVWNTFNNAFTPVPTYVPVANPLTRSVPFNVPATPIDQSLGQQSAGVTAYASLNDAIYAEVGAYVAGEGALSFFNRRIESPFARLDGAAPYWRVALTHAWGAHEAMLGAHGFYARTYSDPTDKASPRARFRDTGVDAQYQYLLDPHTVTAMVSYTRESQRYDSALWDPMDPQYVGGFSNDTNSLDYWRAKATYTFQARFGASLAYTTVRGSADASVYGSNDAQRPDSALWVPEVFWMPVQYARVGLQWYRWQKYLGTRGEYDPANSPGRRASANDAIFLYVWAAY